MTYVFKNLKADTATFEDFREEYEKNFGDDFFEFTDEEDIPTGKIAEANHGFIHAYLEYVELWEDDDNDEVVEIGDVKNYFVDSYDNYYELIRTDGFNWYQNGDKPEELTDDDILNEFPQEWKDELMTEDEAYEKSQQMDDFHSYFSIEDMCEGIRAEIQRLIDEERENEDNE